MDSSIVRNCLQSKPVSTLRTSKIEWLKGKKIIITGGASGIGSQLVRTWALEGEAVVVIGDTNHEAGHALVEEIVSLNPASQIKFVHCDVTDWQSQVNLFKEAVEFGDHRGIDMVVANAGISDRDRYEYPTALHEDEPKQPNMAVINVNMIGVLYTANLGLFWLQRNPGSSHCSPATNPAECRRDRHLLIVGSMASLVALPGQALYTGAKHGVLGLFRSLRMTASTRGVRVNLLCPYFVDTPLLSNAGHALLSGGQMAGMKDVVSAASRFAEDSSIIGRALCVGPRTKIVVTDSGSFSVDESEAAAVGIWEVHADDLEATELFTRRFITLTNAVVVLRGWTGFFADLLRNTVGRLMAGK